METLGLMEPGFWEAPDAVAPGAEIDPAALRLPELEGLVLFQTSGSTGDPKWIGLSRESLLLSAMVVNAFLGVDGSCCWGLALPLNHVGGFGVVARAFESGAKLRCYDGPWDPHRFAKWLGPVTHLSLVPTQVHDLVKAGLRAPKSLRAVVVGGGVLEGNEGEAARSLGWPVLASYGMTEAGSQVATQGVKILGLSYEKEPIPLLAHWKARVNDEGLLEISGPSLFSGWLKKVDGRWSYEARTGDWYACSDLVEIGEDGLKVLGRSDAQVKIMGELVDPLEVERQLAVDGLVVVAVPDPRAGHLLVAVHDDPEIDERVKMRVASYQEDVAGVFRISRVVRLEALPRSELGKLKRGELTRMLIEQAI